MTIRKKGLRVNDELAIGAAHNECLDGFGCFFCEPATGGDHGNAHGQRLWLERADLRNGRGDQCVRRLRIGCLGEAFGFLAVFESLEAALAWVRFVDLAFLRSAFVSRLA